MRWRGQRQSENIEDRRGQSGGFGGFGGIGGGGRPLVGGGLSLGTIAVIVLGAWLLGFNPLMVFGILEGVGGGNQVGQQVAPGAGDPGAQSGGPVQHDQGEQFVATVLADLEDAWTKILAGVGVRYTDPTLVLFTRATPSACGTADTATGPFYCPEDKKVYLDLAFFDQLRNQFQAPGQFAEAYVIAHEVGHHVQDLLGTLSKVDAQRQQVNQEASNALSIRLELQADCYAGIWANQSQKVGIIQDGDIESALNAASAVGDDTLQRRTQGYVMPETFNHGTSAQRVKWFKQGYQNGTLQACDTFDVAQP